MAMSLYARYVVLSKEEKHVHNGELVGTTEYIMWRRCHTTRGNNRVQLRLLSTLRHHPRISLND
jgi:hypothetical protein